MMTHKLKPTQRNCSFEFTAELVNLTLGSQGKCKPAKQETTNNSHYVRTINTSETGRGQ